MNKEAIAHLIKRQMFIEKRLKEIDEKVNLQIGEFIHHNVFQEQKIEFKMENIILELLDYDLEQKKVDMGNVLFEFFREGEVTINHGEYDEDGNWQNTNKETYDNVEAFIDYLIECRKEIY